MRQEKRSENWTVFIVLNTSTLKRIDFGGDNIGTSIDEDLGVIREHGN